MCDVIKVDDPPISSAYLNSFSGVSLEENMISPLFAAYCLCHHKLCFRGAVQPQPYSCRILIRYGFGVAFTAKNLLESFIPCKGFFSGLLHSHGIPLLIIEMEGVRITFQVISLSFFKCHKWYFFHNNCISCFSDCCSLKKTQSYSASITCIIFVTAP